MRDSQMRELGFFNRVNFLMEEDTSTNKKRMLITKNLEWVIKKKEISHKYLLNKFNLTNKYSVRNILQYLFNPRSVYQKSLNDTMILDKTLHRAIRDSADENYNIMQFDFVCQVQIILDFLIGLNFNHKLKITRATLYVGGKEIEATQACVKLIRRKNSLFVVDFKQDFEIEFDVPFANFEVDYQFGKDYLGFKGTDKVTIKQGDCYLLNFPKIISCFM